MKKTCINSPNITPALGPYSHAVRVGDLLFVSGMGPFAKDGSGAVPGTIEEETILTLNNLKTVLEDAGSGLEHVVKTTCFLNNMDHFNAFNEIYAQYFSESGSARSCIEAARLPKDIQVEVEAIALIPEA
ncbi:MAG: RidA family protein [Candidatus Hydrogenedentes bacterium]|nr:RidA family protein [Candidatus Hydrogenedentota bacterium]